MKWSFILSALAMVLYASEIVVSDLGLSDINPWSLTLLYGVGMTLISLPFVLLSTGGEATTIPWPTDARTWGFLAMACVLAAAASWAHFSALHEDGGAVSISSLYMLLPVVAAAMMSVLGHGNPSGRMVLAWVLAGGALLLASEPAEAAEAATPLPVAAERG